LKSDEYGEIKMKTSPRFIIARLLAGLWRFNGLKVAEKIFSSVKSPTILSRPFFGYRLFIDVARTDTHQLLYLEGARFILERRIISELVRVGDVVADVGANIGYYALMFSRLVGESGKVICFEPEPDNLRELHRNLKHNFLTHVRVTESAVGDVAGECTFARGINGTVCENGEGDIVVDMVSLDSVIQHKINFLKVDVEGYEGHVLAGAERLIREHRPVMFVEVHPSMLTPQYSVEDIVSFVGRFYSNVEICGVEDSGFRAKVSSRYFGRPVIRRTSNTNEALSQKNIFWMICS
jgi:FkbM family methyltransferase